ncbi:hypothetical protein K456DRAFT_43975 [Colletotrichum gloeosporioides 23]|nr:hypothetical protein K456DRAFT_43975 [Colletotrichum gloeosporioides 23]
MTSPKNANTEQYYRLIHRALSSREDRSMTLHEIYEWFRLNTTKDMSRCASSIRYNLSMNEAFVQTSNEQSKWHLSSDFIYNIQPTSIYRKKTAYLRTTPHRAIEQFDTFPSAQGASTFIGTPMGLPTGKDFTGMSYANAFIDDNNNNARSTQGCFNKKLTSTCFQCLLSGNKQCDRKRPSCTQCSESGLLCEEQAPFLKAGILYLTTVS